MKNNNLSFLKKPFLLTFGALLSISGIAQTTITTTGYTGNVTGSSSPSTGITFEVQNTNSTPITLNAVGYSPGSTNVHELWYSATSLTGGTGPINATSTAWFLLATVPAPVTTVANTVINQNFFNNLNFSIPGNTTYRFAVLITPSTARYSNSAPVTVFSANGVNMIVTNTVWGGSANLSITGRFYFGSITFTTVPPAPNNAGIGSIPEPPTTICAGNQDVKAQVKNTGSAVLNNVKVNWSVDGTLQPQVSHTTPIPVGGNTVVTLGNINFPASVNKTVKVWTSLPNGVADTVNTDDTASITRNALPAANATITATGPTRFCPGGSVVLQAPTGPSYTYQWKLNSNNITGATSSTFTATASGTYTATVNNSVCATNSNPIVVTAGPPQVSLGNDTAFCEGKSPFVLDANEPVAQYMWSTGDTTKTIALTDQGGTIWVNVILGASCIATDTIEVDISPLPRVSGMSYIKENGYTYFFEAAGPRYVDDYLWIFSDNTTDTGQKVTHMFPVGQHHAARLVISNSCAKDSVELQLPLSVTSGNVSVDKINVYPNPAYDQLNVDAGRGQMKEVIVMNTLGAIVYKEKLNRPTTNHMINVNRFANGNYILRVVTDSGTVNKAFEVMK